MNIEKPTQRKTVQWDANEINNALVKEKDDFRKKVLQFESHHVQEDNENSDSQDSQSFEGKSQKTIEIEGNLKKAKINRVSQRPGQPINLKQLNRRISVKENIPGDDEVMDLETRMKKMQFEKKKAKICNEGFALKKNY